jgi:NADPH:quinone reductase-like Zn-dependent oxidoreductase
VTTGEKFAQALWYIGPGRVEIRTEILGALPEGTVRVRAIHGAISRGTEALVGGGRVPTSEYQRMRGPHMEGRFPFPVKYGYSTVGRVEAGPSALLGEIVYALHPHQTVFDLPVEEVVPVPENVPTTRAALAANMETALNAVWDADPGPSGRVAVVGAGTVGALTGFLCAQVEGTEVTLVDVNPAREDLARRLGLQFATPENAPTDCDLVFHTSASAAGLITALGIAGDEAAIIEMSWFGTGLVSLPLGGAFHSRRLRIISSQVSEVAPSRRDTVTKRQRLEMALGLTAERRLEALLAPAIPFRDLPARLPAILKPQSGVLCQLISY